MNYYEMYKDIWIFHKKYIDKVNSNDETLWKEITNEADILTEKYSRNKFMVSLVMLELEEFERLHHEQTKQ